MYNFSKPHPCLGRSDGYHVILRSSDLGQAKDEDYLPGIVPQVRLVGSSLYIWSALYVLTTEFFNYPSVMDSVLPVKKERLSHM